MGGIRLSVEDGRARLVVDSPGRRNAISAVMWEDLRNHAEALAGRPDIRVVTVEGAGGTFSSGADITGFEAGRAGGSSEYDDLVEAACRAVEVIGAPTVASVEGACIGAGLSLAAACDLRWCAREAWFQFPAARLGLGYDPRGVDRLVRVFGPGATRQLLYTAERMAAERAFALGAVQGVAEVARLAGEVDALARRIASNAPLTLRAAKLAIRSALAPGEGDLRAAAKAARWVADASADYAEGRKAFAERREPAFRGE